MNNDNEVLVKVEGVSKIFCRDFKKSLKYGLKDSARDLFSWGRRMEDGRSEMEDGSLTPISHIASPVGEADSSHSKFKIQNSKLAQRALRPGEFLAVDNVSFELRRGECLGLIGRNGAGKTTLLKMLNGLIKPDHGRIEIRGRIGALIALGSGFNPILTGRENIYVNGSVLGLMREEIEEKIDEIINFAEIREFIDSPVQTYSSGMQVRLGFSIATAMNPDVLILDEVLAVGDTNFKVKCFKRISELKRTCATLFVSHDSLQVARICSSGIWLQGGKLKKQESSVTKLLSEYESTGVEELNLDNKPSPSVSAAIPQILVNDKDVELGSAISIDARKRLEIQLNFPRIDVPEHIKSCQIKALLLDCSENPVAAIRSVSTNRYPTFNRCEIKSGCIARFEIPTLPVCDGVYHLRISITNLQSDSEFLYFIGRIFTVSVFGNGREWSSFIIHTT